MKGTAILLPVFYLLTASALGAGYLLAGCWMITPVMLARCLLFYIARHRSVDQAASVLLVGSFILASVGTMMKLSFVLMLLFWGILIAGVVWLVRSICPGSNQTDTSSGDPHFSPREILDHRYARGEITREQFKVML